MKFLTTKFSPVHNHISNYITKLQKVLKKLDNFKLFKKELKSLLVSHSFCTFDEFLQFSVKMACKVFLSVSSD